MKRQLSTGAVIAVAATALAALSACSNQAGTQNVASTSTPSASTSAPAVPTPAPTTATKTSTASPTQHTHPADDLRSAQGSAKNSGRANTQIGTLPTSAGDYTESLIQAWNAGDKGAMNTYATAGVVDKLTSSSPKGALLRTACEDDMCSYSSESGRRVTLTVDPAKVDAGTRQAVTGVKIDH
ncbi:hypothetical protein [Dermatophilus congolensis]|nr:hypothetical protein [Dermatophilus congolensis]MBO3130054.1 hypothetical protein [Dermatophilus congolensis]MBO3131319.1 hypothetical protein [Dermatophilus congolensis]MBO3134525.1 hypothetical protein [Dermatophilus congolensis]MBO3136762.1 hypothetical protein [Dermatophilus congolensis]MBO3139006.1 hypothetical protein [Dermatophilus congolensis]